MISIRNIYIFFMFSLIFFSALGLFYLSRLRKINEMYRLFTHQSIIKISDNNDIDIAFFDKNENLWIVTKDRKGKKVIIRSYDHNKKPHNLPELNTLI